MKVTFWLPKVPEHAGMNFLGFAGLITVVLAIGALAGSYWWSALSGGLIAVAMSVYSQFQAEMAARPAKSAPAAGKVRPRVASTVAEDAAA